MPVRVYTCARGHQTDHFTPLGQDKPPSVPCHTCASVARYDLEATYRTQTISPDVQEHYNTSLDMPITSRRQLREVQAALGVTDYEKDSDFERRRRETVEKPWKEAKEKLNTALADIAPTLPRTAKKKAYRAPDREGRERAMAATTQREMARLEAGA